MAELILIFTVIFVPIDDNLIYLKGEKYNDILRINSIYMNERFGVNLEFLYVKDIPVTYMDDDSIIKVDYYKNYIEHTFDAYYSIYKGISVGMEIDLFYFTLFNALFYPYLGYNSSLINSGVWFSLDENYIKNAYFIIKHKSEKFYSYAGIYILPDNNGIVLNDKFSLYPLFYMIFNLNKDVGVYVKRHPYIWEYGIAIKYNYLYFSLSLKSGYPYWSVPLGIGYYVE